MADETKPDQHSSETVVLDSTEPVKALGVKDESNPDLVRVGGHAVRFSTAEEKDLTGEYFTAKTYFGSKNGDGADVLFNHGQPIGKSAPLKKIADMTFGVVKSVKDEIGIFMETVLDLSDEYQKAVYELIEQGKLAWSTGSASHVVKKAPDGQILRWPIIEASLTPVPCEPRLPKIQPLKSITLDEAIRADLKAALPDPTSVAPVDNPRPTKAEKPFPPKIMDPKDEPKNEPAKAIDLAAERKAWQTAETQRKTAIRSEAKSFENVKGVIELRDEALDGDTTPEDFRKSLLAVIGKQPEALRAAPADETKSRIEIVREERPRSLGETLINSEAYKNFIKSNAVDDRARKANLQIDMPEVATKATFLTSTGPLTSYDRVQPGGIMLEQQRLTISDLLAQGTSQGNQIRYWKEDTYTNAATTVAEEGLKPDASWDISEVTASFSKIAVIGRVSDELFEDYPAIRSYVDGRLRFMVEEREEAQVLNGGGTGSDLTGILVTSGIQTQAMGSDNSVIAAHKAKTKVRAVGHFEPDGIVVHPNDWEEMKLTRDGNDQFYGGGPFYTPYAGSGAYMSIENIWGLRAVITTAITEGTALVGAFKLGAQLFRKGGLRVDTTNTDGDDFKYNRIAIRVEERVALAVYRPKAFCKITGI